MFHYINLNPLSKREEDCVCRAITLATQQDYSKIQKQLNLVAELYECEGLCVGCYEHLLTNVYHFAPVKGFSGLKVKEVAKELFDGTYLLRCYGHLTCIINGMIHDTWDCGEMEVDKVWKVY